MLTLPKIIGELLDDSDHFTLILTIVVGKIFKNNKRKFNRDGHTSKYP